jgi:hypothetical protein
LGVLNRVLGINKLQFLIEKIYTFLSALNFFLIFGHRNPGSRTGSGSKSAIRKNAGSGSATWLIHYSVRVYSVVSPRRTRRGRSRRRSPAYPATRWTRPAGACRSRRSCHPPGIKAETPSDQTIETREGWLLQTVETKANGDSRSTYERGPSLVGSLGFTRRHKRFLVCRGCS